MKGGGRVWRGCEGALGGGVGARRGSAVGVISVGDIVRGRVGGGLSGNVCAGKLTIRRGELWCTER